ncbi:MAG: hypothetical protein IRY89_09060 [Pseudolabrys sp.]|nr:hypothetical protein [Pseudolabrys sp.]
MSSIGDAAAATWLGAAYSSINSAPSDWISQSFTPPSTAGTRQASAFANLLASTMQNQLASLDDIYARQALLRLQEAQQQKLDQTMATLDEAQNAISGSSGTNGVITTDMSVTVDMSSNILTLRDGTMIDITTGLRLDPVTKLPYGVGYVSDSSSPSS